MLKFQRLLRGHFLYGRLQFFRHLRVEGRLFCRHLPCLRFGPLNFLGFLHLLFCLLPQTCKFPKFLVLRLCFLQLRFHLPRLHFKLPLTFKCGLFVFHCMLMHSPCFPHLNGRLNFRFRGFLHCPFHFPLFHCRGQGLPFLRLKSLLCLFP